MNFLFFLNWVNQTAPICPRLSPRGSGARACFWGCYYRAAPGLFGLICPELRSDWRSRGDAEDAAWSLSNRPRCWSTKWRVVCISACLIGSDRSYSCWLMYVMKVRRQWCSVQLKQSLNWDLQLLIGIFLLSGLMRWNAVIPNFFYLNLTQSIGRSISILSLSLDKSAKNTHKKVFLFKLLLKYKGEMHPIIKTSA